MKYDKRIQKNSGFTLVELIVALALLSILIVAFTNLFTSSYSGIFRAGGVSRTMYNAQQQLEQQIENGTASESDQLLLVLPGYDGDKTAAGTNPITVNGQYISGTYSNGTITTFIPRQ